MAGPFFGKELAKEFDDFRVVFTEPAIEQIRSLSKPFICVAGHALLALGILQFEI